MKQGYTHISIVLDRSGSMYSTADDAINGFNRFLADQKQAPGQATLTLVQFDNEYEVLHSMKPIGDIPELNSQTFVPRGTTALLDAIGRTVDETGAALEKMDEAERPEHVIFVVITDGAENASRIFDSRQINLKVEHQRETYNWQFVFIGANQDAITSARALGIARSAALTYAATPDGTSNAYASLSANVVKHRAGLSKSLDFTEGDRQRQWKAGIKKTT